MDDPERDDTGLLASILHLTWTEAISDGLSEFDVWRRVAQRAEQTLAVNPLRDQRNR